MNRIIWAQQFDPEVVTLRNISAPFYKLLSLIKEIPLDKTISGIYPIDSQPWIFSVRPVFKSDGTGPIRGRLIMGKIIDKEILSDLQHISQVNFKLYPVPQRALFGFTQTDSATQCVNQINNEEIVSKSRIYDLNGTIAFILESPTERFLNRFNSQQAHLALIGSIVGMCTVILLIVAILNTVLIHPLLKIIQKISSIHQNGEYSAHFDQKGCREIIDLSTIFNILLSKVDNETRELSYLSEIDGLTGLTNRRKFDDLYNRKWNECSSEQQWLTIIIIDVDFFKKYNDSCGHQAGDSCLRMVADIIKRNALYVGDIAARYGGEEFAVILPNTTLSGGMSVAERMRHDIERLAFSHPLSETGIITISLGVSSTVPSADTSPERLFARADAGLYRAKENGRNRVETIPEI